MAIKKSQKKWIKFLSRFHFNMKKNYKIYRKAVEVVNGHPLQRFRQRKEVIKIKDYEVPIFLFTPKKETKKVILFFHGGGFISGSIYSYHSFCSLLAEKLEQAVISVDYRLAPEFPFPVGLSDCYEATEKLYSILKERGVLEEDITLMGDSAGGNLAAVVSLMARDKKSFTVKRQVLIYPLVDTDLDSYPSIKENGTDYLLTEKQIEDYLHLYLTKKEDYKNPYVAPILADLSCQPDTFILVATYDPLKDQGKAFAKHLQEAGNKAVLFEVEELHGFMLRKKSKANTFIALDQIKQFINGK